MPAWERVMDEVVRTRRPALVGYAYLLTGSRADAEDVVQEAIVRTFARGRAKNDVAAAEAYVRKAIAHEVINRARHRGVAQAKRVVVASPEALASHADAVAGFADLEAALRDLTARERAVVVLRYVEDLTVPQISTMLALRDGTVKRYLANAAIKLRETLGGDALDDTDVARSRVPVMEGR